jgi:hypothetical protein
MNKMANNKGTVILLAVIAVGALGLSGYLLIDDLFLEKPEGLKLVGLWDRLSENFDTPPYTSASDFLIAYDDVVLLETDYVTVHNETRFYLPVAGIYKININVLLSPVVPDEVYWVVLMRNTSFFEYFERIGIENPMTTPFYYSKGSVYVNVTGGLETYYEIYVYGTSTAGIDSNENFNQLSIEYVFQ